MLDYKNPHFLLFLALLVGIIALVVALFAVFQVGKLSRIISPPSETPGVFEEQPPEIQPGEFPLSPEVIPETTEEVLEPEVPLEMPEAPGGLPTPGEEPSEFPISGPEA